MIRLLAAALLAASVSGLVIASDVIVPEDAKPFMVEKDDIVRIPVEGIAGTVVTATVKGPAKETINQVIPLKNGMPVIGPGNHEVELKPTGKGKVTVEITVKPPNAKAAKLKYEFTVK